VRRILRIGNVNEHLKNKWGKTARAQPRDGRQETEKSLDGEYTTAERVKEREKEKYVHADAAPRMIGFCR
jgi:hypothetical protein